MANLTVNDLHRMHFADVVVQGNTVIKDRYGHTPRQVSEAEIRALQEERGDRFLYVKRGRPL